MCGGQPIPWHGHRGPVRWPQARVETAYDLPHHTDCRLVINVHFDKEKSAPSATSCDVLVPGTGHWPDLVRQVKQFPVPGSPPVLVPMTLPFPPYIILWCLPNGKEKIHFVLQCPRQASYAGLPPWTASCQAGAACASFSLSLPSACEVGFQSRALPWVCVCAPTIRNPGASTDKK